MSPSERSKTPLAVQLHAVVTEESSSVTILERQSTGEAAEEQYYSGVVEVAAGENSYVQYGSLQNLSDEAFTTSQSSAASPTPTRRSTGSRATSVPN